MKSVVLCLLDGWGCSDSCSEDNAIRAAYKPFFNNIITEFPHSMVKTSGVSVGLPPGQIGSSEVGHTTIGSGRVINQPLMQVTTGIKNISTSQEFLSFLDKMQKKTCHIIGMLSDGGVHSHQDHIFLIASELSKRNIKVPIHIILDGRDTPPMSAIKYIESFFAKINSLNNVYIATVCGRYYAMDRDKRFDRTQKAYECIVNATGERSSNITQTLQNNYINGITDEFTLPIITENYDGFQDGESIFIANFRPDRVIQIGSKLVELNCNIIGMMKYSDSLKIPAVFKPEIIKNTLGEVLSNRNLKQVRIAETEKYAHATYFLNAKKEEPFPLEERILLNSPKVETYDLKPEMSAFDITNVAVKKILSNEFSFTFINYANADMVGHTGNFEATKIAISTIDSCLRKIFNATTSSEDAVMVITADHGNAESMLNNGQPHTAHTINPVPFIVLDKRFNVLNGSLADIAPTVLDLLNIPKPTEMTGTSLITKKSTIHQNEFIFSKIDS